MTRVGVFDSGAGGKSVADAISGGIEDVEVIYESDPANVPYGTKTKQELLTLTRPKIKSLANKKCEIIVIACNSVSTTVIDQLKTETNVPLIGVEPMVEEASNLTKSGVIAVCATPRTLTSHRYEQLRAKYAQNIVVIEPDCSQWALMIEQDAIDRASIKLTIQDAVEQDADVIVLACTHYHWIESLIVDACKNRAVVLQPEKKIIERLKLVLKQPT
jgi:glutamate racemase